MFARIKKRDGREVPFDESNITDAIFKAAQAVGGADRQMAMELTLEVLRELKKKYSGQIFSVEDVQDMVEKVLIERGHAKTAKAYILYRAKRTRMREARSDLMDAVADILVSPSRGYLYGFKIDYSYLTKNLRNEVYLSCLDPEMSQL